MTRWLGSLLGLVLCCVVLAAQATPISTTPSIRFTGQYNYVATGGSLRNSASNACSLDSTRSQILTGIPAGSTIVAAYLYWGGSGSTVDSTVTLNGATITANRTFTTTTVISGFTDFSFFGGFADITSRITGNGTLTFGGLSVDSGGDYCNSAAVTAGWSVIVIYGSTSEPLRAINIFDGLDWFRGSALPLSVSGFRIPASGIDGKMTVVTWEGDPGNSDPLNGFSESLSFNGNLLDDGIVPAGSSPTVQQYDGTINTLGLDNTYGVDVDTYNVSPYLSAGQTSANTNYSAGGDLVLLTAQVVSVTSEPVVDLSIIKTHTGNFTVGSNGSFTLHVANGTGAGVISVDYPITVTDVLPTGLSYVSATGTGWTCSASGQTVTCTNPSNLARGSALPDITLTVAANNDAFASGNIAQNTTINNTASVAAAGTVDATPANNSATDTVTILGSNLSTSTKNVSDLNGGDANPGDVLRYTITLINSSAVAATNVAVNDNIPGNVTGFSVVSLPSGAVNTSTGTGSGPNGTGVLNITNITVPASSSVVVTFDVTVATGTSPGATIDNTASINNPAGVSATPSAPQVVVSPSQIPGSGTKQLYLWSNPGQTLSRTRPSGTHNAVSLNGNNVNATWISTPGLQQAVSLKAGNYNVTLLLARSGATGNTSRTITVSLSNSALGALGSASQTINPATTAIAAYTFTMTMGAVTAPVGSTFTLSVNNNSGNTTNRSITITPYSGTTYSRVDLNSLTVINVDSVLTYNAAYAAGVVASSFNRGTTMYVRAVVSDPFGSFDISSASITLRNPSGTDVITAAMTQVNDSGAALKTYEYVYTLPANAPAGAWSARVTANEGAEGTITDLGIGTFTVTVPMPTLQVSKISDIVSDPVNTTTNPKRIPGSIIRYTITVTNTGPGAVDASSLVMTDAVPVNTTLCVAVACGGVVQFIDGTPASGLSFSYASNVTYSTTVAGAAPFDHSASPDANGFDATITGIRIAPVGTMSAASVGNPNFSIRFYVKVN